MPGPGPAPWLGLAAVLVVLAGVVAVAVRTHRLRWMAGVTVMFAALAVLLVADVVHLVGILGATKGSTGSAIGRFFTSGYGSLLGWIAGGAAFVLVRRKTVDSLYAAVFAGAVLTMVGGLSDVSVLSHSSVPFAFSAGLARLCVALTLGLGVGVVLLGIVLTGTGKGAAAGPADDGPGAAAPD